MPNINLIHNSSSATASSTTDTDSISHDCCNGTVCDACRYCADQAENGTALFHVHSINNDYCIQKPVSGWTPNYVAEWLEHVKLRPVEPQLLAQNTDGPKLLTLRPVDLSGMRIPVWLCMLHFAVVTVL